MSGRDAVSYLLAGMVAFVGWWLGDAHSASYCQSWLLAFVLTQAIEAPIYKRFCLPTTNGDALERWWPALLPSALTHPLLWFALPAMWSEVQDDVVVWASPWLAPPEMQDAVLVNGAETLIWLAEGAALHWFGGKKAWLWALVGNGASYGFGLLLSKTIGWP